MAPWILGVQGDGNCCFRAFLASLCGHANFEVFHKTLREKAARILGRMGSAKGGKLAIDKTWAGTDALQVLGEVFGVRMNMFRGGIAESYCAVGCLDSHREVNLVLRRGHWCGVRGSIPPILGRSPLNSSDHPMHGGSYCAPAGSDHAEESQEARLDETFVIPSDTSRCAFANLLEGHRGEHEGNSVYVQRPREEAARFKRQIGAPSGYDAPRLLSDGDLQVSTFLTTLYSATYRGQLGPMVATNDLLTLTLFLISVADFVKVEHQVSGTRQAWCYLQDDGSWAPIPRTDSLPLAVIQKWLFPLNAAAKIIAGYLPTCHVYLSAESDGLRFSEPAKFQPFCAGIGFEKYAPASLSSMPAMAKDTESYFDGKKPKSFPTASRNGVYQEAKRAYASYLHLTSIQKKYMEQRNFELFVAHILVPHGKDDEFSEYVSESRPMKVMNFKDFALHISTEHGVQTVAKRPENMALTTIPMELHAKVPAAVNEKLLNFIEKAFRNNEASFNFLTALLCATLFSDLELQREYFLYSKGRSGESLLSTLVQAALPGVAKTFGHDLLCSHELLMKAGPSYSACRILIRSEIPSRADKMSALTDVYKRWTGLCPITANEKWQKHYGSIRVPQLKLRETNNFPTYRVNNIDDLKPILERNMAIPFLSTFLSPPSVPRGDSFLEFPADDSLNHFMTERPTALAFIKSILYPFLMDTGLSGIIDLAQTPPTAVTEATKDFRNAITEEHGVFLQSTAKARPTPGLPTNVTDAEEHNAGPLPHWASMEHFFEDELFEGQIGYSDFYDRYLKFCAHHNYVGSRRASRPAFYSEATESYSIIFDG